VIAIHNYESEGRRGAFRTNAKRCCTCALQVSCRVEPGNSITSSTACVSAGKAQMPCPPVRGHTYSDRIWALEAIFQNLERTNPLKGVRVAPTSTAAVSVPSPRRIRSAMQSRCRIGSRRHRCPQAPPPAFDTD
jgi:hypothetical protein